jgi:hypothetical protein
VILRKYGLSYGQVSIAYFMTLLPPQAGLGPPDLRAFDLTPARP